MSEALNVWGRPLQLCCSNPMTGFYRDGFCRTGAQDHGRHLVCAEMTEEFLQFSKSRGNDLSTPRPEYQFRGLGEGDQWCLCALRWLEAHEAGCAPRIYLEKTHQKMLDLVDIEILKPYALDLS